MIDAIAIRAARAALEEGAAVRLAVKGRSMSPVLENGARIEVVPLGGPPQPGDVIACTRGTQLVVHRVVRVEPDGSVVTRGDTRREADAAFAPADVLGHVQHPGGAQIAPLPLRHTLGRVFGR